MLRCTEDTLIAPLQPRHSHCSGVYNLILFAWCFFLAEECLGPQQWIILFEMDCAFAPFSQVLFWGWFCISHVAELRYWQRERWYCRLGPVAKKHATRLMLIECALLILKDKRLLSRKKKILDALRKTPNLCLLINNGKKSCVKKNNVWRRGNQSSKSVVFIILLRSSSIIWQTFPSAFIVVILWDFFIVFSISSDLTRVLSYYSKRSAATVNAVNVYCGKEKNGAWQKQHLTRSILSLFEKGLADNMSHEFSFHTGTDGSRIIHE